MSMSDPIADMLTRIRNAGAVRKQQVEMPASKTKVRIATILKNEGYIADYTVSVGIKPTLNITLKYHHNQPVIQEIKRISRPGRRIYKRKNELPQILGGLGIAIISTSQGLMTANQARKSGHGGEVLCSVW
ncbi:Ribosomal protein S8 [Beggiatoa sp. PS]|nr:Ribosomal protein S8 [Beggiatoa sp. PS]